MCVIIEKPAGETFDRDDLLCAYKSNNDGFGFMFYDPKSDRIIAKKSTKWTTDNIADFIQERMKDTHTVFHYRYKTHGEVIDSQCHPFKILDKKRDGIDMYFMHNGVINKSGILAKESDTQAFNRNFLRPMLKKNPMLVESKAFQGLVESYIGQSKLCFMYGKGKVIKYNEDKGAVRHNCWVSNESYFGGSVRAKKYQANNTYQGNKQGSFHANRQNTTTTGVGASKKFLGVDSVVGDKILIWAETNPNFFSEGTITEINQSTAMVDFVGDKASKLKLLFWLDDGCSSYSAKDRYYGVPAKQYEDEAKDQERVGSPQKKESSKSLVVHPSTSNVTSIKDVKQRFENEKKDKKTDPTETTSETATSVDESLTDFIEHEGYVVDNADRLGGGFLQDAGAVYGDWTLEELYDMTPKERLEFFMEYNEVAFNMWQDLLEFINIYDAEFQDEMDYYEGIAEDKYDVTTH